MRSWQHGRARLFRRLPGGALGPGVLARQDNVPNILYIDGPMFDTLTREEQREVYKCYTTIVYR